MTAPMLASSFLSGSLLAMLVPMAIVVTMLTWGVLMIRRHERRRGSVEPGERSTSGGGAPERSRTTGGG
jgi:hypothetical protein